LFGYFFLFISKLSKELNWEIIFKEKNVIFQDLVIKENISERHLENDLYFLDSNKSIFNSRKDDNLSKLWHKRVGHPSDKILNYMFDFLKIIVVIVKFVSLQNIQKFLFIILALKAMNYLNLYISMYEVRLP
jgi:hypothetical protein